MISLFRHWWKIVVAVLLFITMIGTSVSAVSPSVASSFAGSGNPDTNLRCDLGVMPQKIGDKLVYTITDRAILLNMAKKYGWAISKGDAIISEAVFVIDQQSLPVIPQRGVAHAQGTPSGDVNPLWGVPKYYIQTTGTGQACGVEVLRDSYYYGPATATMTVTESVSAKWSANVGISASVVNAGVGFDVTESYTVSDSYNINVPPGYVAEIIAHPIYNVVTFDVWYDPMIGNPYKTGSGDAMKPIGVCLVQYRSPA
ncbi:MAG: hypothetical protein BSOLF_0394 [Candidatus Carbobacillus altaicus]|uniref:Uncharacterized protein n=1 Tax=Candidatus Carbonibacillus altaicus TaxID=2163959 RepID=A0A2R6Y5D4_9BACL|nr:MAG: hypothetical protein BSOLF_0394 [Candidatus Carbobacillus altaicus]